MGVGKELQVLTGFRIRGLEPRGYRARWKEAERDADNAKEKNMGCCGEM